MLKRAAAAALCLVLTAEGFAAELPVAPIEGAPASPVVDISLPVLAQPPVVGGLAAPLQLELPLAELPAASAEASARTPSALAAAKTAAAAAASPRARASVAGARAAGERAFDAAKPAGAAQGSEPVLGVEGAGTAPLAPSGKAQPAAWRVWVPHAITGMNLTSGVGSALFAVQGMLLPAAALIVLAAVFDAFDGFAARKLGVAGEMGTMMDSQADGVSFGAAPAILIFATALKPLAAGHPALAAAGFAAAAFSAFAAAYRLSRYNLDALAAGAGGKPSAFFKGLPSPGGAAALIALAFALPALPAAAAFAAGAGGTLVIGAAMMSRLPYLKVTTSRKALLVSAATAAALAAPLVALGAAALAPAAVLGAYLLSGPAVALYRGGGSMWKKELTRKAFHQLNLLFLPVFLGLKAAVGGEKTVAAFAGLTALVGFAEYCRLYGTKLRAFLEKNPLLKRGFDFLESVKRDKENKQFSGVFYGTLGAAAAAAFAVAAGDWRYMAAAIFALTFGDAASATVGMRFAWKPYRVRGTLRSADGTAAGFAVAFAIGWGLGFGPWAALGAAVVFSLVDTYPVRPDDNLWIPALFPAALAGFARLAAAFGGPAAGLAALAIGAAGAWLIFRATTRP